MILNLVSNATRFTDVGGIVVRASQRDGYAVVEISDTGPGIPPEDAGKVFEPFYQVPARGRTAHDGSGLGLSICQQLIERHGGRIALESKVGEGTTISFWLPMAPKSAGAEVQRRLIVDDWVFHERAPWPEIPRLPNRQRVLLYDETGALFPVMRPHAEAVELIETVSLAQTVQELHGCPAHAVIINAASQGELQRVVDDAREAIADTPIVACSFPLQMDRAIKAGAVDYLVKPVRRADLRDAIERGRDIDRTDPDRGRSC